MAPKDSGHRGDLRRDRTRTHTVKNPHPSSQSSSNSPINDVRPTSRNTHATTSNTQTNPQPLNSQALHQHTSNQAQLSQNPYHTHIIRQNETRSLQESFYFLGVDIPSDFYQNKISGIYQSQTYASFPTQDYTPTQAYSTQYLATATAISYAKEPTDENYTCTETRDEYENSGKGVSDSSNDLGGIGGQFPVYSYQTPRYSQSVYEMEADMMQGS